MRKFGRRFMRALRAPRREKSKEAYYAEISNNLVCIMLIIAIIVWFCKAL